MRLLKFELCWIEHLAIQLEAQTVAQRRDKSRIWEQRVNTCFP